MYVKSIIYSFLLVVGIGCSFDACAMERISPDRCATPSSPAKYCADYAARVHKAKSKTVYLDFEKGLLDMLEKIAHDESQQKVWGACLETFMQILIKQKKVIGLSIKAWSLKNITAIEPMIQAFLNQVWAPSEEPRFMIDYERPFSPDNVSTNK